MAAHRYWRMMLAGPTSVNRVAELILRTTPGGAQEATGGSAFSNPALDATNVAARAFDGNTSTYWAGSSAAQDPGMVKWIGYDLGAGNEKDIVEFVLDLNSVIGTGVPESAYLQYSDDNTTWTTVSHGLRPQGAFGVYTGSVLGDANNGRIRGGRLRINLGWPNAGNLQTKFRGAIYRLDAVDGGSYKIVGDVAVKGTPDTPVARRVVLLTQENFRVVRQQWSAEGTGAYSFLRLKNQKYVVMTLDYTGTYRAVCADQISPEAM